MPIFKTKKMNNKKKEQAEQSTGHRKQQNALSTFYRFLAEKVDCGTIAQIEHLDLEPNWLLMIGKK